MVKLLTERFIFFKYVTDTVKVKRIDKRPNLMAKEFMQLARLSIGVIVEIDDFLPYGHKVAF